MFLNWAFEIKNDMRGKIILVSFDVFLSLSKMIPNELPDVGLRLEFIGHSYSFQSNATDKYSNKSKLIRN